MIHKKKISNLNTNNFQIFDGFFITRKQAALTRPTLLALLVSVIGTQNRMPTAMEAIVLRGLYDAGWIIIAPNGPLFASNSHPPPLPTPHSASKWSVTPSWKPSVDLSRLGRFPALPSGTKDSKSVWIAALTHGQEETHGYDINKSVVGRQHPGSESGAGTAAESNGEWANLCRRVDSWEAAVQMCSSGGVKLFSLIQLGENLSQCLSKCRGGGGSIIIFF